MQVSEEYIRKLADKGGRPRMVRAALVTTLAEVDALRSKRLREGRMGAGLSLRASAALLDLSPVELGKMERGDAQISVELSDRAADVFKEHRSQSD